MSLSSWRQINFFNYTPIKDPFFNTDNPLYSDPNLSSICSTSNPDYLIIATDNAIIKIINKTFQVVYQFQAYELGTNITFLNSNNNNNLKFLVSIGEKQGHPIVLKLWNLNKFIKYINSPSNNYNLEILDNIFNYHSVVQIHNGNNQYPLSTFSNNLEFSLLAFGFTNGSTILVRGDLVHDKGSRQRIIYQSNNDPITGNDPNNNINITAINNINDDNPITQSVLNSNDYLLYIITTSKILVFETNGKSINKPLHVLENHYGSNLYCNDILYNNNLIISNSITNSIDFYNFKYSKINSISNLNFNKLKLFNYLNKYLLIVSSIDTSFTLNINKKTNNILNLSSNNSFKTTRILMLDYTHNFITFNLTISNNISNIFFMWNNLYLLSTNGILYKLSEKSINQKIELLIQRNLYPISIQLVQEQLILQDLLLIKKKYGDYLFSKNEFEDSINQYIQAIELNNNNITIDIILKFKNNDKILLLTSYLENLFSFQKKLFYKKYLTLLLCNYCKLKDLNKLNNFIHQIEIIKFQSITNNDLLLKINFYKIALKFSLIFKNYSLILELLINKFKSYKLSLNFLRVLQINDLLNLLISDSNANYAKILLHYLPIETTKLLIDVFTGIYKPQGSEELIYKQFDALISPILLFKVIIPGVTSSSQLETQLKKQIPTYQPPRPRLIFSSFVNNPSEFVIFLEACLQSFDKFDKFNTNVKDKKDLLITLFEMYLTLSNDLSYSKDKKNKKEWESKAIKLYKSYKELMDYTSVLLICNLNNFQNDDLLLDENENDNPRRYNHVELLRSSLLSGNISRSIKILRKFGDKLPELYNVTLILIIKLNSNDFLNKKFGIKNFLILLNKILKYNLMSLIDLIKILSLNNLIKIKFIKHFLINYINFKNFEIEKNLKLYNYYKREIESDIDLNDGEEDDFIVLNNLKCNVCSQTLDFPIIHFICHHSYHQRCLSDYNYDINGSENNNIDKTRKCPKCVSEMDAIKAIRASQDEIGERNDLFKIALKDSDDKFKVITDFYGRGAMEQVRYVLQ
ncbi:tethering complex subunit PEP5 ASCRUDRAFT_37590 [Ascoidea rubescens DSM 1968]|uniref:E3 ubiquitin-protein ligase PEP5 n=1 Tax=Ascoidea rubescens DSM 1968 TaxID=1344418 RepID=A0A1D2VCA6_9ASCO|nr:hypothetical protein ASCRUDRAFT_37590 [Ascoidea rubescens DSM 1968]ODV59354.1 hypothetical protein ASCRUDRAFT_37590 [Ascoidea rubescens DSM 1968]